MADIELVVKIPEEAYELLKNKGVDWLGAEHILNAVANGTPLPKGHGDLKDTNELKRAFILYSKIVQGHFTDADVASIVLNVQPTIKADEIEK